MRSVNTLCLLVCELVCFFFFSSRRRHTRCALVTGVQTCALPICFDGERLCDERYRVVAERKFAMRRLEPRHVKRLAIHFESGTEQPLRCPVGGPAIARAARLLVAGLGIALDVGAEAFGAEHGQIQGYRGRGVNLQGDRRPEALLKIGSAQCKGKMGTYVE